MVRAGLVGLFREHGKFRIVGQAATCAEALAAIARSVPDLVLLDSNLTGCNSIELIRQIRAEHPELEGCAAEAPSSLEAIEKLDRERLRLLRQLWDRGAPIPVPRPPLSTAPAGTRQPG